MDIKKKKIGGLVMKRRELESLLNEQDSAGLAFGVLEKGEANHVGLVVYKVTREERGYVGEAREVSYQKGAQSLDSFATSKEDYLFEYLQDLKGCGFDFSFLEKSEFQKLFDSGGDEVFITGAVREYGSIGKIKGRFFTLAITPRFDPELEKDMGVPPDTVFMDACPPLWQPDGIVNGLVKFSRSSS